MIRSTIPRNTFPTGSHTRNTSILHEDTTHEPCAIPGKETAEPASNVPISPIRSEKPIKCFLPSNSSRYDRNIAIGNILGPWEFEPLQTLNAFGKEQVPAWEHHVQAEGQPYFRSSSRSFRSLRSLRYLTEENLSDSSTRAEAERFTAAFERKMEECDKFDLKSDVEIVFEFRSRHWCYYMVDLDHHRLFWIDKFTVNESVLDYDFGIESSEHLRHMFEFEYWQHIDYFPNHRPLQDGLLDEILCILLNQHIDNESSSSSTSPFDRTELEAMIRSVKKLRLLQASENVLPYVVQASARIMAMLARERFYDFYGFNGVRLSPLQSVRGQKGDKQRTLLIKLLSPALLYAPEVHLKALENVYVDNLVKLRRWEEFQEKIKGEWERLILNATVLLNANVAFLAVPNILSSETSPKILPSPEGVVSQISTIASLGSIIIGLLLVSLMRADPTDSCDVYLKFLEDRTHQQLRLESLAILHSLPYALLIFAMVTFLAAFAVSCFNVGGDATFIKYIIYGIAWSLILAFILWTIYVRWQMKRRAKPSRNLDDDPGPGSSSENQLQQQRSDEGTTGIELTSMSSDTRSERSRLLSGSTLTSSSSWSFRGANSLDESVQVSETGSFLAQLWKRQYKNPGSLRRVTV